MSQNGPTEGSFQNDSEVVQPGQMPNTLMQDDVGADAGDEEEVKVFFFFFSVVRNMFH